MGSGVVTVGRRVYAVGLYWENSPTSRVVAAAREAASQPGQMADFYAVRAGQKDGHVPQFGLGQASAGHKATMPAFAGCLANQQPGSWVGAFRLREGTVITVVRDDLIVPDGDQLFLDENDGRERLLQEISFGGLQKVYAPESWAIPGSDNMPISLLMNERRDVKLQTVAISKSTKLVAAAVVLLIVASLGIGWYIQDQAAKRAALEAERMDALARARAEANKLVGMDNEPHYPPPERKWEAKPPALEVIESCRAGLQGIPAAVAGWRMGPVKCDGASVSLSWDRDKGISVPPKGWVINETATVATAAVPLPKLTERGHEDLANPVDNTRRYLAQDWPATLAHALDDPPPAPPPDYKGPWNPPPAPWVKRSFTITMPDLPSRLPTFFHDLPGVIVTTVTYTPQGTTGGAWSIEGIIYENRI